MLCLTGDVMTGRGVDQILPAAGDPRLWERYVASAQDYVALAESASGTIPYPVDYSWPWGDALQLLDELAPDLRIANLETSITTSDDFQPAKAVLYRMHPGNVACLTAARLDACALANNHVLDFGVGGLEETLDVLTRAGLGPVGAGRNEQQAWRPVALTAGDHRVLVWSVGSASSGVPRGWAAGPERPGVAFISEDSEARRALRARTAGEAARRHRGRVRPLGIELGVRRAAGAGPLRPSAHRQRGGHGPRAFLAPPTPGRGLSGPSRALRLWRPDQRLRRNPGQERFRGDLRLLYLALLDPAGGLDQLRMVPLQSRQMRLRRATVEDARWLHRVLRKVSRGLGSQVDLAPDASLLIGR